MNKPYNSIVVIILLCIPPCLKILLHLKKIKRRLINEQLKGILLGIKYIATAVIIALIIKVYFFEIYKVPTTSMENTIKVGDYIIGEKLSYGPIQPNSLLEVPNLGAVFQINKRIRDLFTPYTIENNRSRGVSELKNSDVVIFTRPDILDKYFVKRCVAIAGDTLELRNTEVYINSELQQMPEMAKSKYRLALRNTEQIDSLKNSNIEVVRTIKKENFYLLIINITNKQFVQLNQKFKNIVKMNFKQAVKGIFPNSHSYTWTLDDFGALYIPKKGDIIQLTKKNLPLYKKIIALHDYVGR